MEYTSERVYMAANCHAGRGVRARVGIAAGELIEAAPVVPIAAENVDSLYATELYDYCYEWRDGGVAVALGCGSLYNHDPNPNATFERHTDTDTLVVYAARDITAGEEIFIDYTGGGLNPLWFEPLPV